MAVLILAKHDNAQLNDATARAVTAAKAMGGDIDVLVAGEGAGGVAEAATRQPIAPCQAVRPNVRARVLRRRRLAGSSCETSRPAPCNRGATFSHSRSPRRRVISCCTVVRPPRQEALDAEEQGRVRLVEAVRRLRDRQE